jgi:hypothetical protein
MSATLCALMPINTTRNAVCRGAYRFMTVILRER